MKKIAFFTLFVSNLCFSQSTTKYSQVNMVDTLYEDSYPFAYKSKAMDTLYLAKNEMGMMTLEIWQKDPEYNGKDPVIVLKAPDWIINVSKVK